MLDDKFWNKVVRGSDNECWNWVGSLVGGYGHFRVGKKVKKAHRLVYEEFVGQIPKSLFVMHCCDNPSCVNPRHLSVGTAVENNRDRDKKGRHIALKGTQHGMSKLTIEGVRKIHELNSKQVAERKAIANELGVSYQTIVDVMTGKTWAWLNIE